MTKKKIRQVVNDFLEQEKKKAEEEKLLEAAKSRVEKEASEFLKSKREIQSHVIGGYLKVYSSYFNQVIYVKLSEIHAVAPRNYYETINEKGNKYKSIVMTRDTYEYWFRTELTVAELLSLMNKRQE